MRQPKTNKLMNKVVVLAVLMIGLYLAGAVLTMAQGGTMINLDFHNIDSIPVSIKLVAGDCYGGKPADGQRWLVRPGETLTIPLYRKSDLRNRKNLGIFEKVIPRKCDGDNGVVSFVFNPKVGLSEKQTLAFSNDGSLWVQPIVNQYPGTLGEKARDGSYTYTTFITTPTVIGKAQGYWERVCYMDCYNEHLTSVKVETSKGLTLSPRSKAAVILELDGGVEFAGIAGVGHRSQADSEMLKAIGRSMSYAVSHGEPKTGKMIFTEAQLKRYNIHSVWQWGATIKLSNKEVIHVKTNKFTCSVDGPAKPPNYLPGSKEDIGTCSGKLVAANR